MKSLDVSDPLLIAAGSLFGTGVLAMIGVLSPTLVTAGVDGHIAFRPMLLRETIQQPRAPKFYDSIVVMPLFNDGRRKDPPPPAPKPAPPPDIQNYRLLGLVISADIRLALVQRSSGGEQLRIHPGDRLDSWTVTNIDSAGVQLTAQGITAELTIPHYSKEATPATLDNAVGGPAKSQNGPKPSSRFLGLRIFEVPKAEGARAATAQTASPGNN